ncbi:SurA N-terminal domain-containing protein [Alcanivorax sp. 1008]|uniref:SurA N-terminal domain-containing protein n=1 Tax=Alcanivorax sp. 1008 TaxID=2816853 RepID=UPI001D6AA897|nr:SurA N-terminal domain-containing protein [Alcanivorax sp. 1008]MCC1496394.1 SurA N-terminal domain-containing protein [Alcanivorax sp. 1008]
MQSFRKFIRGPVGMVLLVLFVVPFIITGFYGYFESSGSADVVAEVEGVPIYGRQVNERVQQMRQQVRQQSPDVDPRLLDSFINAEMVLEGLISNELIALEARRADMAVSEDMAARMVYEVPQFRDENGQFSPDMFERFVRSQGMTQRSFISNLRRELVLNQARSGIQDTDFALPAEVSEQRRLAEQRRDIRYLRKSVAEVGAGHDATDQEISDWYEANQASFLSPEALRLQYLVVDPAQVDDSTEVSEEQIAAEYEVRRAAMEQVAARAERRNAAHLLVSINDERNEAQAQQRISSLQDRLNMGEDFAALAKEASDDISTAAAGGDLGPVGRGDLPESMEQALFALEEGEVSQPVRTDSGYHLVKLSSVRTRDLPAMEDSREDIIRDLHRRAAEMKAVEMADRLEELAFEHSDLQTPAAELGLEIQTTDWLTLASPTGLLAEAEVREAVVSPALRDQRLNSELIQLADGRSLVVRIDDIRPAAPMPIAEVSDRIRAAIQREKALADIDGLTESARQAVAEGKGLDALAELVGAQVVEQKDLQRTNVEPSAEVVRAAFRAPRPAQDDTKIDVMRLANGDLIAIAVVAVRDGGVELDETQQAMALAELGAVEGSRSLRHALALLRDTSSIDVYESRLNPAQLD